MMKLFIASSLLSVCALSSLAFAKGGDTSVRAKLANTEAAKVTPLLPLSGQNGQETQTANVKPGQPEKPVEAAAQKPAAPGAQKSAATSDAQKDPAAKPVQPAKVVKPQG